MMQSNKVMMSQIGHVHFNKSTRVAWNGSMGHVGLSLLMNSNGSEWTHKELMIF